MTFTAEYNCNSLPASSDTVALFIAHLHQLSYAYSTIRTFISAVSYCHQIHGLGDPTSTFLINKTLTGLAKVSPTSDPRKPITIEVLSVLIKNLDSQDMSAYKHLLCKSIGNLLLT